jgi:hypothetical protein
MRDEHLRRLAEFLEQLAQERSAENEENLDDRRPEARP